MHIIEAYATQNKCYQIGTPLKPRGIMLHSIGCPQPNASVMAQNFNQYLPNGQSVCVHAFVQRDGTVYQTLPWTVQAWHCGGAANNTHIGVEMTEPPVGIPYAEAAEQITGTYHTAVELFAQLCEMYGLNPLKDGVIIGHAEGHRRGVASNHADPEYLWDAYGMGFTMDSFRYDVTGKRCPMPWVDDPAQWTAFLAMLTPKNTTTVEEDDDMATRYNTVAELPAWAQEETQKLIDRGALQGDEHGNLDVTMDMLRTMIVCQRMVDGK